MNSLLFVAAIAAFLVAPNLANNCQSNHRCPHNAQTLCKYPNQNLAAACGRQIRSVGFSYEERKEIINKHNELRRLVADGKEARGNPGPQPAASNMKTVSWDYELAQIAQRWTNQCEFGNDECRDVDRFPVGQNPGMKTTGDHNTRPSDIIMMWYNEVKDMNRNLVNSLTTTNNVSHYTQMIWANTDRVGCGKIVYQVDGLNRYYMVCNYGPAGNLIGQPVYQVRN